MMLAKFRQRYPQGSLVSELIEIDRGFYLVKVSIQIEQIVLATGLAGASTIEAAEDSARERAIAAVLNDDPTSQNNSRVNTATTISDNTSSTEPILTKVSSETEPEPEPQIVNFSEASSEADEPEEQTTPNPIPEPIPDPVDLESEIESTPQPNLFSGTTSSTQIPLIEQEFNSVARSNGTIATANFEEMDFNEIKQKTDIEIKRLGWTKDDGREFLKSRYGKRSRLHLTDEQLLEFLGYLEKQPTPVR